VKLDGPKNTLAQGETSADFFKYVNCVFLMSIVILIYDAFASIRAMEANAKKNIKLIPMQPAPPSKPAPSNGGQAFNSPGRRLSSESVNSPGRRLSSESAKSAAIGGVAAGKSKPSENASFDFIRRMKENAKKKYGSLEAAMATVVADDAKAAKVAKSAENPLAIVQEAGSEDAEGADVIAAIAATAAAVATPAPATTLVAATPAVAAMPAATTPAATTPAAETGEAMTALPAVVGPIPVPAPALTA
jgi:hypothetical protein